MSVSGVDSYKNTANADAWRMWQAESLVTMPVLKLQTVTQSPSCFYTSIVFFFQGCLMSDIFYLS